MYLPKNTTVNFYFHVKIAWVLISINCNRGQYYYIQVNCIVVRLHINKNCFKNQGKFSKKYQSADCNSDQNLVMIKCEL